MQRSSLTLSRRGVVTTRACALTSLAAIGSGDAAMISLTLKRSFSTRRVYRSSPAAPRAVSAVRYHTRRLWSSESKVWR